MTRSNPGLEELKLSARGICSNKDKDPVRERLQHYFEPLSQAYMEICKKQKRQFFGLRDYYRYHNFDFPIGIVFNQNIQKYFRIQCFN